MYDKKDHLAHISPERIKLGVGGLGGFEASAARQGNEEING